MWDLLLSNMMLIMRIPVIAKTNAFPRFLVSLLCLMLICIVKSTWYHTPAWSPEFSMHLQTITLFSPSELSPRTRGGCELISAVNPSYLTCRLPHALPLGIFEVCKLCFSHSPSWSLLTRGLGAALLFLQCFSLSLGQSWQYGLITVDTAEHREYNPCFAEFTSSL